MPHNHYHNPWCGTANAECDELRGEIERDRLNTDRERLTDEQRCRYDYLDAWLVRSRTNLDRYDLPVDNAWENVKDDAVNV